MDFLFIELGGFLLIPIVLILLPSMIVITGQQNVKIIETFGKYTSTRSAGLSFKLPYPIQTATGNFSLQIMEIAETVGVKSSDNAFVDVPIRVQFAVNPDRAKEAYYKLSLPEEQIRSYIVNQVRSTASGLSFEDLFKSQAAFQGDVQETLTEKMDDFGFWIINVLVDDPQPSPELRQAFDRVLAAQREKEAAVAEGEAARLLSVAKARAEGEALQIKADAYASFRKIVAEGNSEAIEAFRGKTGLSAEAALEFFVSINEMEAMRDAAAEGGNVVFVSSSAKTSGDKALMGLLAQNKG
ncbi:SPFH domain-containing protein [Kiloniella sp. b19]|uniref:SPFH domain-containing protein n=1 Tax=Kiloniella sp. GXU_MW_B19 TaxID=3141326 RepID=UPI0031CE5A0A